MKKFVITLFVVIIFATGCNANNQNKLKDENENLSKKISEYETIIRNFKEVGKFNISPFEKIKTCEFTKTFKVYKIINEYISTTTIDKKYVILTVFQSEQLILTTIANEFTKSLEENKFYEFKFSGNKNFLINTINDELIFGNFNLVSVNETSKSGLEQINNGIICK